MSIELLQRNRCTDCKSAK